VIASPIPQDQLVWVWNGWASRLAVVISPDRVVVSVAVPLYGLFSPAVMVLPYQSTDSELVSLAPAS